MKLYAAIDLHSNNSVLVIIDENDRIVYEKRLSNELGVIMGAMAPYREEVQAVAVESTYNWYWLVDGLMDAGYTLKLVNTAAVTVYEGLKYTGDEHDARHLAHLLKLRILPTGYIYPKAERAVRDLLRKRSQMVRCQTMQILSIQNLVSRNSGKGITTEAIRQLTDESVARICGGDPSRALAIQSNRAVLRCLDEQIKILGMTIMYEMGTIDRFARVGQFASYARCVESRRMSNGKKKGEGNSKNGNKYLAWAFVEAAHHAIRCQDRIRQYYQRKKAKKNGAVATKAVAHKLARACYHVLKDQVIFDVDRAFA